MTAGVRESLARVKRIAVSRARLLLRGRRPPRRFNLHLQKSPGWEERTEVAVTLWLRNSHRLHAEPTDPRVVTAGDLGCGNERVRRVLAERLGGGFRYQGYDLHPQRTTTVQLDLRHELPERRFDVLFCLGLLEYLPDPAGFLARISRIGSLAVVSYAIADAPDDLGERERRARGWLSDLSRAEFEALAERAEFEPVDSMIIEEGRTGIWLLASRHA